MKQGLLTISLAVATAACSSHGTVRTQESRLKQSLFAFRTAIDKYTFDHHRAPRSLEDLVQEHYLHEMPVDPITNSKTTWRILREDPHNNIDKSAPGIFDIRSGSTGMSLEGTRYSEW